MLRRSNTKTKRDQRLRLNPIACYGVVDSDDYVDIYMFEILYKQMINSNSDIVICEYYENNNKKIHIDYGTFYNKECIYQLLNFKIGFMLWNKLFHKSLFKDLEFPSIRCCEETNVILKILYKSKKIVCINDYIYFYRIRKDSLTNQNFNQHKLTNIEQFEILNKFIYDNLNLYYKQSYYLLANSIFYTLCLAYKSKELNNKQYLIKTRNYCLKYLKYILFNPQITIKQKIGFFHKIIKLQLNLLFYLR